MKTIIIDDERLARKELTSLLSDFSEIEIIAECSNAIEAKEKIEELKPDLIFLDIQMPEKTGFDLLEELDYIPHVVFVTAYNEFAIKAFEVNAFDYILKPIDSDRLKQTINKINSIATKVKEEKQEETPTEKLGYDDQIFIKDGEKCWFVKLADVRFFESEGNYVKVFFQEHKPLILKSLTNIENKLEEKLFFRTSRKHIVNMKWIDKVDNWFSGGLKLTLNTGEEIEVSRRQAQKFRDIMSL